MEASSFIVVSGRLADDELGGGAADAVDVDTGRHAVGVDDDVAVAGLQCHLLDELALDVVHCQNISVLDRVGDGDAVRGGVGVSGAEFGVVDVGDREVVPEVYA